MDSSIKQLDKSQVKMLRKAIQDQLDKIGQIYGMTIRMGNIRFDSLSLRTKLEAHVNEPATGTSFEQESFKNTCWAYGLKPEHYLAEVSLSGSRFYGVKGKIYGFNARSRKYQF